MNHTPISAPKERKGDSPIQVLQVCKTPLIADQEDDYHAEGLYVCSASLVQALRRIRTESKQIDVVIVGLDCSIADIESIREVALQQNVTLILHTLKFDWKAKEIAFETGVDEYHVGPLNQSFIQRVKLIKQVKSFKKATDTKQQVTQQPDERTSIKLWFLKRTFDITVSLFIILLLSPSLLIILPFLMYETRGSVLCSSKRVGKNYKVFNLFKFRCLSSSTGQFLRQAHLEELPQVLNVLKGDMSFVGNRPIPMEEAELLTSDRMAWRFLAPVGMVGLWQFNDEVESNMSNWDYTEADIEYAMTNTMWLDLRILCGYLLNLVTASRNSRAVDWCLGIHRDSPVKTQQNHFTATTH